MDLTRRQKTALAVVAALATAPFVYTVFDTNDGDIPLYHRASTLVLEGSMPYRDYTFEYPPYAFLWFALPALAPGYAAFRIAFALELLALDVIAKVVLFREGVRLAETRARAAAPLLLFSLLGIFQAYFYLKRLDVIAATLSLFALVLFARGSAAWSGALLAVAVGTKLYPALMAPALFYVALRNGKARAFVLGGLAGIAPVVVLSLALPWWRFASFHAARGLQVESTYASILWLLHFAGLEAQWVGRLAWMDVDGPTARALLPIARVLFGAATLVGVALSVAATRTRANPAAPFLARVVLIPVLAFMAFNIVLSPQYAIWLIPLAAIAALEGATAPIVALAIAVALTTFIFPAPDYLEGLHLARTGILVARNVALLVALGLLVREQFVLRREETVVAKIAK